MKDTVTKRDNDGHRFEIPAELESEFDRLFNHYCDQKRGTDEYWDAEAEFNNQFEDYMVG